MPNTDNRTNLEILLNICKKAGVDISDLRVSEERTEYILLRALALGFEAILNKTPISEPIALTAGVTADIPLNGSILQGIVLGGNTTLTLGEGGLFGTHTGGANDVLELGLVKVDSIEVKSTQNINIQLITIK